MTSLRDLGNLLRDAFAAHRAIDDDRARAAQQVWFADLYTGKEAAQAASAPARLNELQGQLEQLIVRLIADVKPSADAGGKARSIVRSVLKGKLVLTSRATSEIRKVDRQETDSKELGGGKFLVRRYPLKFEAFSAHYVTRLEPPSRALPSLPEKDICLLHGATVRKYSKGLDRQLGKWIAMEELVIAPMLCANQGAPGALPRTSAR